MTKKKNKIIGVIPVRFFSTRFPGKPLALIAGKPMIQWVWEGVSSSNLINKIIVATDDARIKKFVESIGGEARMTSPSHFSGTDRIWEVVKEEAIEIIINIQGDEPLITGKICDNVIETLLAHPQADMATVVKRERKPGNENIVKVVVNENGYALYFSRSPIPFYVDGNPSYLIHKGIYGFRKNFLERFVNSDQCYLEKAEKLEQLRALSIGGKIKVVEIEEELISVDVPADIEKVERTLAS